MSLHCSIVIADDNCDAADTLVAILSGMGYHAVAVYDGWEAVNACAALEPELAILDVQMPLLDGCAAARLIRAGAHPPRTIAVLSGLRHWEEPIKSQGHLFDVRLAKPARMDQLVDLLSQALGDSPADGEA
jgi:CheY-like chemotaxis protein